MSPILGIVHAFTIRNMTTRQEGQGAREDRGKVTSLFSDIDLINKSEDEAYIIANKLNKASQKYGIEINVDKTKVMTIGGAKAMNVQLEGKHLKQVT